MGVTGLFQSLKNRYPGIIYNSVDMNAKMTPSHTSKKGKALARKTDLKGTEYDNLYIDLNEIVHNCVRAARFHKADDRERRIMEILFEKIDQIFSIVRPRKLLYVALDGVAPRAKRTQQRIRRFGRSKPNQDEFDGNCVSPGTSFMCTLSKNLMFYFHRKLSNDPQWKNISVIFSDSNVPGEGEHKIADFIRQQRTQPCHDPVTKHVICGNDADLILLGLASHETNVTLLRGDPNSKKWIFVGIHILRQCLDEEFRGSDFPFDYHLERIVDDWIFLCILLGNDFLPSFQMFKNPDRTLTHLVRICKNAYNKNVDWLTHNGSINSVQVKHILSELGRMELAHHNKNFEPSPMKRSERKSKTVTPTIKPRKGPSTREGNFDLEPSKKRHPDSSFSTEPTTRKKPRLDSRTVTSTVEPEAGPSNREIFYYELDERQTDSSSSNRFVFKKRYYESKFGQPLTDEVLSHITQEYAKGLDWILSYYFQGVPSWNWFYPYDYAPFAIDLTEVSAFATHFDSGTQPLLPLEQLMSLLPPWSSTLVPLSWGNLMSDSNSTIAKFYPSVCKGSALPFLDEDLMKDAVKAVYDQLTDEEKERNTVGSDKLLVGQYHKGYTFLRRLLAGDQTLALQPKYFSGISGEVSASKKYVRPDTMFASPLQEWEDIKHCNVLCSNFRNPVHSKDKGLELDKERIQ